MSTNETKGASPLVSIICDVFNHEDYLRECLNGLVNQNTDFDYIILIHDDASTDISPQIINEYVEKYPKLFEPIFQKVNQYSQGIGIWKTYQFPRVHTKYVAFCEGDDYWIDQNKLQKQVDFLEVHKECSGVFGNIYVRDDTLNPVIYSKSLMQSRYYDQEEMLKGLLFPLASICVRKTVIDNWNNNIQANGDIILAYTATQLGKIYMMDDYMSVYRKTGKGVCTSKSMSEQLIAELSEWYFFHNQLNFPHPSTLIYHQSQSIFRFYSKMGIKSIPFKKIIKYIRIKYILFYIYYLTIFTFQHLKTKIK